MRALYLLRRNNDIDHIAPVVYRLARRQWSSVALCQDPFYELEHDFRLQYLRANHGVRVDYAYRMCSLTRRQRVVRLIGRAQPRSSMARRAYGRFVFAPLLGRAHRSGVYGEVWAGQVLEEVKPNVIVFDHNPPTRYASASFIAAARRRRIPLVAMPHGTHMLVNELRAPDRRAAGRIGRVEIFEPYDHVVVMDPLHRDFLVRMGVPAAKITLLGSARYCAEWRAVLTQIAPPPTGLPVDARGRLKLVYMDKQARDGVHQEVIDAELRRIALRPDVALVVKPETRTNLPSSHALRKIAFVADRWPSAELIEWADAVMVSHSSIAIEVLQQNKTLLHASYFHDNLTTFDEMGACWALRTSDALDAALDQLARDRAFRPYSLANVGRFLAQVVDAGTPGRDVLADHADFIERIAGARPATVRRA